MADLIDKFYSADLSESEEEALDGLLESSQEAAEKFAQKAAEAYARYGLPETGPEEGLGMGWRRGRVFLGLALVLLGGLGLWRSGWIGKIYSTFNPPDLPVSVVYPLPKEIPAGPTLTADSSSSKGFTQKEKTQSTTAVSTGPGLENSLNSHPQADGTLQVASTNLPQQSAGPNGLQPPPASSGPAPGHSRLKIDLAIAQSGPVTVRILDSTGEDVKDLYRGALAAGTYAFTWDGKLDGGKTALPGKYQIQTLGPAGTQVRDFWIQPKKKTAP
jgi:hypothetical protein